MNTKPKILLFMFVAAGMVLSGCAMNSSAEKEPKEGIYPAAEARFGIELLRYEASLGEKIATTHVHPSDSMFLSGKTTTKPDNETDGAPSLGLFGSIGTEDLRVIGGLSARWNPLHHMDGTREGFYSTRQQVSDIRPPSQGSFVFTQLVPSSFTLIPSVGLEGKIRENITIGGNVGFPYMGWTARSGHDRWGSWETVQDDSWRGFGIRYAGTLGWNLNDDASNKLIISVFYEEYEPTFAGESAKISGVGGIIGIVHKW